MSRHWDRSRKWAAHTHTDRERQFPSTPLGSNRPHTGERERESRKEKETSFVCSLFFFRMVVVQWKHAHRKLIFYV